MFASFSIVELVFFVYSNNGFFIKASGKQIKLGFFPKVSIAEILDTGGLRDFFIFQVSQPQAQFVAYFAFLRQLIKFSNCLGQLDFCNSDSGGTSVQSNKDTVSQIFFRVPIGASNRVFILFYQLVGPRQTAIFLGIFLGVSYSSILGV